MLRAFNESNSFFKFPTFDNPLTEIAQINHQHNPMTSYTEAGTGVFKRLHSFNFSIDRNVNVFNNPSSILDLGSADQNLRQLKMLVSQDMIKSAIPQRCYATINKGLNNMRVATNGFSYTTNTDSKSPAEINHLFHIAKDLIQVDNKPRIHMPP